MRNKRDEALVFVFLFARPLFCSGLTVIGFSKSLPDTQKPWHAMPHCCKEAASRALAQLSAPSLPNAEGHILGSRLGHSIAGGGLEQIPRTGASFPHQPDGLEGVREPGCCVSTSLLANVSCRDHNSPVPRAGRTFRPPSLMLGTGGFLMAVCHRDAAVPWGCSHATITCLPMAACRRDAAMPQGCCYAAGMLRCPMTCVAMAWPCQPQQRSSGGFSCYHRAAGEPPIPQVPLLTGWKYVCFHVNSAQKELFLPIPALKFPPQNARGRGFAPASPQGCSRPRAGNAGQNTHTK